MRQKINRTILAEWVFVWMVMVAVPTIYNPFMLKPWISFIGFEFFILWFGYFQVLPNVNWDSFVDWVMAYFAVAFFGSICCFLLPCFYGFETAKKWNLWCELFTILWFICIDAALITVLFSEWKTMGWLRIPVIMIFIGVLWMIIMSIVTIAAPLL